jgi:signal transduction histidine kinase
MDEQTHALLAGLAHDLRTPLAAIGGYAELLRVGVHGPLTPRQLESLERIRINHVRMAELITDMMEYAEAVRGTQRVVIERFGVQSVIARSVEHAMERATQRNITLAFRDETVSVSHADTAARPGVVTVAADRAALDAVLRSVLRDAIEAASDSSVDIRLTMSDGMAVIAFESGADPIDEATSASLFEASQRQQRETRPIGPSTMILPRARLLARAFGGEVRAVPHHQSRIIHVCVQAPEESSGAMHETGGGAFR